MLIARKIQTVQFCGHMLQLRAHASVASLRFLSLTLFFKMASVDKIPNDDFMYMYILQEPTH